MWRTMVRRLPDILRVVFLAAMTGVVAGCTSQPPIVADPPEHTHTPPEIVPWEEQYARTRPKPEVFEETTSAHDQQVFNGHLEHQQEEEGVLDAVVDVIAFPFRGLGWVLQQLF